MNDASKTLHDFICALYNDLLEAGWRMGEIDGMDILGYLRIRAWRVTQEQKQHEPVRRHIDEVWPSLKP